MMNELERVKAKAAELEAEAARLEELARLAPVLRRLGEEWRAERGPRKSLWGTKSKSLTQLEQVIREACAAGMSGREVARTSGVSRDLVRRIVGEE